MSLNKQMHTPVLENGPGPADGLLLLAEHIADCIAIVIPHPIAIFVPGELPPTYNPDSFPAIRLTQIQECFEKNAKLLPNLMKVSDPLSEPQRFSDGSRAFLVPLFHNGTLEAVLCLYDNGKLDQELLRPHLIALEPICRLAASFISRARQTETEAGMIKGSHPVASHGNSQAAGQFVSGFLRTVSHDIRTPITAIRGFAKMMLDGRTGPISDSQRECLRMSLDGVDQLINVAASVNGASGLIEQIRAEVLDFHDLLHTAIRAARPMLVSKAVTLEENIERESGTVCGDRRALAKVLERLMACVVRNVEYRGTLRVELRCRNDIRLMLTLLGAFSLPEAEETLAGVREVVFLHGGQVALRPEKEGGQALILTLPGYIR